MFDRNRYYVPVNQLKIGMFVSDLDRPWLGTPFLIQGFEITSKEDIQQVSEICKYVYIDKKKSGLYDYSLDEFVPEKHSVASLAYKLSKDESSIEYRKYKTSGDAYVTPEIIKNVRNIYQNTRRNIHQTLERLKLGHDIDIYESKKAVEECVDSIFDNKDSLLWYTLIKKRDAYTSEHSLNVTILSIAFARYLGHSKAEVEKIGLCGLLHDVGKIKIPLSVLNKEGKFTKEDFDIMMLHPGFGFEYLIKQGNVDHEVAHAAYSHHERMNGSGYPQGLTGQEISYYAKLIAITDTYDAITNDRCYQRGRTAMKAQKILYERAGSHYDEALVKQFIQWLGIYPPASIVEMSNGEVGIVLSVNQDWKTKPRVVLILDKDKQPQTQRIVDLYRDSNDKEGNKYYIKTSHPNNTFGINLMDFKLEQY